MSDVITLSDSTRAAIKKLFDINQSLKIAHDQTTTREDDGGNEVTMTVIRSKSGNRTMMARIEVPEVFPRDVHIYDLREFNSAINIVSDPEFDFSDDKCVVIRSKDNKQQLRYVETSPDLIDSYIDKDLPECADVEFVVTEQQFKSVLTAARTMKLNQVGFISDGETLNISAFDKNNGDNRDINNFSVELTDHDREFRMFYKLDTHNISVLESEGDLLFKIDGKRKVSQIETQSGKTYWIAFDSKSEWN